MTEVVDLSEHRKRKMASVPEPTIAEQADKIVTFKLAYRDDELIGCSHDIEESPDGIWKLVDDLTEVQRWLGKKAAQIEPLHPLEILATAVVRRGNENHLWFSNPVLDNPEEALSKLPPIFADFVSMITQRFQGPPGTS